MKMEQSACAASAVDAKGLTVPGPSEASLAGLGQRIADIAESLGGKRNLARQSGVHETQLYKYIRGGSAPSLAVCVAMAQSAGVSLDWLIRGGDAPAITDQVTVRIQRYPARACVARLPWPGSVAAIEPLLVSPVELRQRGLAAHTLLAVQLHSGQACAPLFDGGTVLIDRAASGLAGDGLYLLELGGTLRVQRVQFQCDGSLSLLAINEQFRDLHLPHDRLAELNVIGRVLWICSWQG
ncbi:XRE family transcriptional regulator [Pseudomonas sp. TE3610]